MRWLSGAPHRSCRLVLQLSAAASMYIDPLVQVFFSLHFCDFWVETNSKLDHNPTIQGKNPIVTQRPRWHHGGGINYREAGAGGEHVKVIFYFLRRVFPLLREVCKDPAFGMWL